MHLLLCDLMSKQLLDIILIPYTYILLCRYIYSQGILMRARYSSIVL